MTNNEQSMLDEVLEAERGLSPRDIDFIDNLDQHWRDKDLSTAQRQWLEDLIGRIDRTG
jgi:hypothetical protein